MADCDALNQAVTAAQAQLTTDQATLTAATNDYLANCS